MQEYIAELSNYFITICMALYTFTCFLAFRFRDTGKRKLLYTFQTILTFGVQSCSFLVLSIESDDIRYLFFYTFIQVFLFAVILMVTMLYEKCNRLLLNNMCMLLGVGLCMVSRLSFSKAVRQYVIAMISLIICLFIPYILEHFRVWKKLTWFYALLGISMLSVVLFLSEKTYGANISFTIKGLTFQPSEFVKILFVFFLAAALWQDVSLPKLAVTTVLSAIHVIVLVLSKDLGSALIFFICFVFVVFVATRNYLYLLLGAAGGCAAACVAYQLFDHVRIRVLAWRDPWSYIDDQGYQITQSLFAVGSGSWFGMGLLKGNPKAIPFVDADMIFSSVCEEFGVIFGICLILVCISCFVAMLNTALRIRDRFYQLIVYGFGMMYIFQIFLTIGGGIKFIPLTGVTLPFISYGGSSVMTTMLMFFIVQGIHVRLMKEGEKRVVKQQKEEPEGTIE